MANEHKRRRRGGLGHGVRRLPTPFCRVDAGVRRATQIGGHPRCAVVVFRAFRGRHQLLSLLRRPVPRSCLASSVGRAAIVTGKPIHTPNSAPGAAMPPPPRRRTDQSEQDLNHTPTRSHLSRGLSALLHAPLTWNHSGPNGDLHPSSQSLWQRQLQNAAGVCFGGPQDSAYADRD